MGTKDWSEQKMLRLCPPELILGWDDWMEGEKGESKTCFKLKLFTGYDRTKRFPGWRDKPVRLSLFHLIPLSPSCGSWAAAGWVMMPSCDDSHTGAKGLWLDMISVQVQAQRGRSGVTTVTKADYSTHATKEPSRRIIFDLFRTN